VLFRSESDHNLAIEALSQIAAAFSMAIDAVLEAESAFFDVLTDV